MIYRFSTQNTSAARFPGGGLGCLLTLAIVGVLGYYTVKGLYYLLWWAAPALIVLTLIINWRVIPDTLKNWLDTLSTRPLTGLFSAALAVLAFPFFALYLFLKALGYRKIESMQRNFETRQQSQDEFADFEELESTPLDKKPEPEPEPLKPPEKEKPQNPYDGFFGA